MKMSERFKIMLVDDTPSTIRMLQASLEQENYIIETADCGEAALQKVQNVKPHLILLDIMMPGMDGFTTCEQLKKNSRTRDIPIIFMSALSDPIDKVKGFSLGGVDYLTKPINIPELLARTKTQITLSMLQKELRQMNMELEKRVALRTSELYEANLALRAEIEEHRRTEAALLASEKQRLALYQQVVKLEESERRRLARELHDRVGQNITALSINLNMALSRISKESQGQAAARLHDAIEITAEMAENVRDVVADLRPHVLDDYGLWAALKWELERFSRRTGIRNEATGREIIPRPSSEIETALFRIAQEALTNICKHANAGCVRVELSKTAGSIQLAISDDGIGYEIKKKTADQSDGWGLLFMRERIQAQNGSLKVISRPGQGTQVIARIRIP
jgi:two-component system sensor histidine kinase/response regulator